MTQNPKDEFVPDGQAGGDGPEEPIIPDDASQLIDIDSPVDAPVEGTAEERSAEPAASAREEDLEAALAERTADLQRLHAEYVNYKKRVDRDRDVARLKGVESVVNDLLPVVDAIEAARQHDQVDGGFKLVVEALQKVFGKHGLVVYGEVGEEFDPHLHEALMQVPLEGDHTTTVISAVMQKGIQMGDRIVRPARVGVADPN
ncbi:nucleotide exchange factor GrpE [Propioniciclava sinopodophylli]|uniref:nucleotide exchange factor GrpE n=1 Tax=Propioniciclava sinopodophylli TaxID=1837344 RepID=UPI0026B769AC